MKTSRLSFSENLLLVIALAATAGCRTLQYRTVQSHFEETVRADNERFAMPFTDVANSYQVIAKELTPEYINGLDSKLQPNAWTLRAVSQWRAGESAQAVASSVEGLAEIARLKQQTPQLENGRDSIILTMLPGLVEDSRLRQRFKEQGPAGVAAHYDEYAAKFRTALRALTEARAKVAAATPSEVVYYWNYQCWRVLQNWSLIMAQLKEGDQLAAANNEADSFVKTTLPNAPNKLPDAIKAVEEALPEQHPYRQLMNLEAQR